MYTKEEYALIKSFGFLGYNIYEIEERNFVIIEVEQKVKLAIKELLESGADVFENQNEFDKKYPPLGFEERKRRGLEFFERIKNRNTSSDNS